MGQTFENRRRPTQAFGIGAESRWSSVELPEGFGYVVQPERNRWHAASRTPQRTPVMTMSLSTMSILSIIIVMRIMRMVGRLTTGVATLAP